MGVRGGEGSTLHGSLLPLVCLNEMKKCKALWMKVLNKCSHLPPTKNTKLMFGFLLFPVH